MKLFRHVGRKWIVNLNLQFEPRDLWVGIFWRVSEAGLFHVYICLVPLIPFHITIAKMTEQGRLYHFGNGARG